jgi:uncharacterized membrane protein
MLRTVTVLLLVFSFLFTPSQAFAQETPPTPPQYQRATIQRVVEEQRIPTDGGDRYIQTVEFQREGATETEVTTVGTEFQPLMSEQRLESGERVIVTDQSNSDGQKYTSIADVFRLPVLGWLFFGFILLVVIVARGQGLLSFVGMLLSLGILSLFIVPQILGGANPLLVGLVGSVGIACLTVYLSHGWSWHSHIALFSMSLTLLAVLALSVSAVSMARLMGLGSEEAYFLQFGSTAVVNLRGLLLTGMLLGALGILDDICIAQVSVVMQLKEVNDKLSFNELYARALSVGRDHVASLVNTLVLAYAGANLPLFLLFSINKDVPLWVTLNNEIIAEEIVRTLVGSIGLVLAVPIATLLAAAWVTRSSSSFPELARKSAPHKTSHPGHRH